MTQIACQTVFYFMAPLARMVRISRRCRPDQGFAPIHEVAEGRNKRIEAFYWRLQFGQDQALPETIDLRGELLGPETTITAATIERF